MEHQKFIIGRFDHYYDSINNKGNVFLTLNIFIIGGLFTCLTALSNFLSNTKWCSILIVLMIALSLLSMIFSLKSVVPYIRKTGNSRIYFGNIATMPEALFLQRMIQQTEPDILDDLNIQIYDLAKGLKMKFRWLYLAGVLFFMDAVVMVPLVIIIIKNLK